MGKRHRNGADITTENSKTNGNSKSQFLPDAAAVDPSLALLFASSAGPVQAPPKVRYEQAEQAVPQIQRRVTTADEQTDSEEGSVDGDEELSSVEGDIEDAHFAESSGDEEESSILPSASISVNPLEQATSKPPRKRKRQNETDDIEGNYMLKLAQEEEKEEAERQAERRLKRQRLLAEQDPDMSVEEEDLDEDEDDESAAESGDDAAQASEFPSDVPKHETLVEDKETTELEKASRTVFLANVSTACITDKKAKKALLDHMGSFLDTIAPPKDDTQKHKVESLRFRSTAYAGSGLPKKAAFATKALMEATTKSTNAYVVYSNAFAAREAVKRLNASVVLDRHLRVDGVAHPAKTDHRRCVFVGNLGFVDDESMMDQDGENERKRSKIPSDVEEGLWRQFGKAGSVESVRVVRDEKTRVGKGFAYVQFHDANSVEAALLFHEKKFPPMLPRVLRVTRAKAVKKTALASQHIRAQIYKPQPGGPGNANNTPIYNPKLTAQQQSQQQSLQGRAGKLLGRAGASQFKQQDGHNQRTQGRQGVAGIAKTPESIVFEGYRASAKNGRPKDLKLGGKGGAKAGKKGGKPKTRSSKRGTDWKKGGGRKGKAGEN